MKIDRHGKAKILSQSEIQLLFRQGLENNRSRALFGICLYCCCRINEDSVGKWKILYPWKALVGVEVRESSNRIAPSGQSLQNSQPVNRQYLLLKKGEALKLQPPQTALFPSVGFMPPFLS